MLSFLVDGGQMGAAIRAYDWNNTQLGHPAEWPTPLKTLVGVVLGSNQPMFIAWGSEQILFYNDAYAAILANKHPGALGGCFLEVWSEIKADLVPIVAQAYGGVPVHMDDITLMMNRRGYVEEAHFAFSYTPIRGDGGVVEGLFCACTEITEQVLADRRREADTQRQRQMFEQAPGFITILHGPEHVFEFANATYRRLFGDREFVGKTVREAFPELSSQGFYERLDQVYRTGERFVATHVRVVLDRHGDASRELFLDFIYEPITDDANEVIGIFVEGHDATEARRAQAELRESEERFRRILEGVKDYCIFTVDTENRVLDWTPGAETVFGWRSDEMAGATADILFTPEDRENGVPTRELATARDAGCANDERWHIRRDGSRFFANGSVRPLHDADGEIAGFIKIARDETERRAAEAALRETEQRYRLAAKATNDAIWDWDLATNRVEWNEAVQVLFGYINDQVEPTAAWWIENIHPEDRERVSVAIHQVIDGAGDHWAAEYRFRRGDGTYADVFDRGHVFRDEAGPATRMIGAMLDLTERKHAENALRDLNETLEMRVSERTADLVAAQDALRQAQKMEAVGQLTGGLAHDFNNLLTGISGSLEMMQVRITQGRTEDVERYIVAAQGAAKRAAALTHRLLAFSRRQTLAPKPTNVNQLVSGMADLIQRTVGPSVELETVNAVGLWPSLIDPSQLENAVLNLCINARDAMPEGGRITIETSNRWMDQRMAEQRGLDPGQYISLCVSDTGTGMPADVIAKAFDPFFTTKPIGEGTGLGLSMIYGFAKQSGGSVAIYSELGQGAMVCIYLPRHLGDAEADGVELNVESAPRAEAGETVLVVDDEPTVRMLVAEVLTDLGYTAIEAADGAAGLKVINSDLRIDLLVTDVGLPGGLNGRQVADAARAVRTGLKVLFITGYAENAVLSHGHLDPGMHVLTKPFAMDVLATRIRELIQG
ncbi:PAS domain-containing hybrid sensor histidine kinase/response regulator [Sphingomonas sp. M1-B02]|uniref:PAS domain-containing hybrid sensor histidine kinase/response regulator n=1 Tax=Sphingomonas sp. M1-B02 TaxID=3114300 RepID=UPI00223F7E5C|nr:PAS domain S-box protein [Sphingomonas sp. S6-11]UZK67757.1 PAS domain S-box protein [Sphingomonas sp. S6-11]